MGASVEVTVLMPCLNEAETLEVCIRKAKASLAELGVDGEVLVSDNGSTDGSQAIALANGARVVSAPIRGYGGALMAGIDAARGEYVIMADADDSYALDDLGPFVEGLRAGHDVVMGNRFLGGIEPGAMPALHKYLGNPVLSRIGKVLFGLKGVNDFHCGIRGFRRDRVQRLGLCMPGMEFASELVVRAAMAGYDMVEVPTTLRPDGRSRPPHLRTWRDGWRHLRFLVVFAPRQTLVVPGMLLALLGLVFTAVLETGPLKVGGVRFDTASLVYSCLAVLVGIQLVLVGGCARLYTRSTLPDEARDSGVWAALMKFETLLISGLALVAAGVAGTVVAVSSWGGKDYGDLVPRHIVRLVVPSATVLAVGVSVAFTALLASLITLDRGRRATPAEPGTEIESVASEMVGI